MGEIEEKIISQNIKEVEHYIDLLVDNIDEIVSRLGSAKEKLLRIKGNSTTYTIVDGLVATRKLEKSIVKYMPSVEHLKGCLEAIIRILVDMLANKT